jgi:hypothetical protein
MPAEKRGVGVDGARERIDHRSRDAKMRPRELGPLLEPDGRYDEERCKGDTSHPRSTRSDWRLPDGADAVHRQRVQRRRPPRQAELRRRRASRSNRYWVDGGATRRRYERLASPEEVPTRPGFEPESPRLEPGDVRPCVNLRCA